MREVAALLPLLLYVILKPVGPLAQVQPPGRRAEGSRLMGGISLPKNEILRASFFVLARFDQSTALRMI